MHLFSLISLALISSALALPDYMPRWMDMETAKLQARGTPPSDPCCKSCATIKKVAEECPIATTDIFCGCDDWVKTAPTCQACIFDVGFQTSFAANPGPTLELFWAFCQCQKKCRPVAEAIFGPKPCNGGKDNVCVSKALVKYGPKCNECLEHTDDWFSNFFEVFIEQAEDLLSGKNGIPEVC